MHWTVLLGILVGLGVLDQFFPMAKIIFEGIPALLMLGVGLGLIFVIVRSCWPLLFVIAIVGGIVYYFNNSSKDEGNVVPPPSSTTQNVNVKKDKNTENKSVNVKQTEVKISENVPGVITSPNVKIYTNYTDKEPYASIEQYDIITVKDGVKDKVDTVWYNAYSDGRSYYVKAENVDIQGVSEWGKIDDVIRYKKIPNTNKAIVVIDKPNAREIFNVSLNEENFIIDEVTCKDKEREVLLKKEIGIKQLYEDNKTIAAVKKAPGIDPGKEKIAVKITELPKPKEFAAIKSVIIENEISLMDGPDASSKYLGKFYKYDIVDVIGEDRDNNDTIWYKVAFGNTVGYVKAASVDTKSGSEWKFTDSATRYRRNPGANTAIIRMDKGNFIEYYTIAFRSEYFIVEEVKCTDSNKESLLQKEIGIKQRYEDNPRIASVKNDMGI